MNYVKAALRALFGAIWALIKVFAVATLAAFICMMYIMLDKGDIRVPSPPRPLPEQMAPVRLSPNLDVRTSTAAALTREARIDAMRRATVLIRVGRSLGSGVVVDNRQCLVVTNNHVIDSVGDITVHFVAAYRDDNSPIIVAAKAELVAYPDPSDDLALLRMEHCAGVPWAPLADSRRVQVLDPVFAVGAPHGLSWTFTQGTVSHTHRAVFEAARGTGQLLIQTDAAINPGNSGGPLFNTRGEVIGINSLKYREADNLGFAHPSNAVIVYLANVAKYGYLPRYPLGIEDALTQTAEQALAADVPMSYMNQGAFGVKVKTVATDSLAAAAGLQVDDIIIGAANEGVYSYEHLRRIVYANGPGTLALTVWRNGETVSLTITLPTPVEGRAPWAQPAPQPAAEDSPAQS